MKIINSVDIKSSAEQVFYWLGDPARAMTWMTSVTKTEIIKQTPGWVGTTFREYVEEDGQGTEMRGVVTDFVPNERMAFHLEGDYNIADVAFTLEERGAITRVTQVAEVKFKGLLRVITLIFGSRFKRQICAQTQAEFVTLKELCEQDLQS